MFRQIKLSFLLLLVFSCISCEIAFAQRILQAPGVRVAFPQDPAQWINSAPISLDLLKGKAAFLWYFEEDCPKCKARWPEMLQIAKSFEGKPIVFIAVNSGNTRSSVEEYVRETRVTWPVLVDTSRQFEQASGFPREISLQNIYQAKIITADGSLRNGDWENVAASAEKALEGAKWNIDPSEIPAPLKPAWSAVEFGNYPAAAVLLKKGLGTSKTELKAAAVKLNEYVQADLTKSLNAAKETSVSENPWQAYKAYKQVSERFAGYDLPVEATDKLNELEKNEAVKAEMQRYKQLELAKKGLASTNRNVRINVATKLKKIAQEAPMSDSAQEAKQILATLEKQ